MWNLQEKDYSAGFNRYMVECESFKCDLNRFTGMGFNRYMVECECSSEDFCKDFRRVLIDTWWNVNPLLCQRGLRHFWF